MIKLRGMAMIGLGLVFWAAPLVGGGLNANGDWQAWYGVAFSAKSGDWKLKVEDEIRTGNDLHDLYYNYLDFGLTRSTLPWLDLGANFRVVEEKKNGVWTTENRPYVNAILKWSLSTWSFTDRNRLEYREFQEEKNRWRYRNKLTVYPPIAMLDDKVKPYVADEIFQDLSGKGFERNRVYIGSEFVFTTWLKGNFCYIWQTTDKSESWVDANVISLKMEVLF